MKKQNVAVTAVKINFSSPLPTQCSLRLSDPFAALSFSLCHHNARVRVFDCTSGMYGIRERQIEPENILTRK